jgi:hypothetical protein
MFKNKDNSNAPIETLRRRHLLHPSDDPRPTSLKGKENKGDINKTGSAYKAQ